MKNKKNIMLFALIGIMVIIALVVFLRPRKRGSSGCANTPITTATTAPVVTSTTNAALPAHEEVKALSDWFVQNDTAKLVATCPNRGVFGLDGALNRMRSTDGNNTVFPGPPARGPLAALAGLIAGKPSGSSYAKAPPPAVPMVIEPIESQSLPSDSSAEATSSVADMQLRGVICIGGARVALFGAESYNAGDTIPNTSYRIVAIDTNAVTLRSAEGQKLRLDLLN